jgi:hypothetical protein
VLSDVGRMQVVQAYQGLLGGSEAIGKLNQKERSFCWAMISEACSAGAAGSSATEFMMHSFHAAWKKLDALAAPAAVEGGAADARAEMVAVQTAKNELQTEAAAVCSALCTALEQLTDDDVCTPFTFLATRLWNALLLCCCGLEQHFTLDATLRSFFYYVIVCCIDRLCDLCLTTGNKYLVSVRQTTHDFAPCYDTTRTRCHSKT